MIDSFFSSLGLLLSGFLADDLGNLFVVFCLLGLGFALFSLLRWGAGGGR